MEVASSCSSAPAVNYSAAKKFPDLCVVLFDYWKLMRLLLYFLLSGTSIKETQRGH